MIYLLKNEAFGRTQRKTWDLGGEMLFHVEL